MAEAVIERVRRYICDGSDEDLRRLLAIAQVSSEMARTAFRRIGVQEGWNVIDCGCGPIGGLAVIAEMVGPSGRVVGVDFNEAAVQRARSVVAALGLDNVEVVVADINEADPAHLGGPFDVAFTRLFLMHQGDPVHTLARIAGLLRPGGAIVAQEPLRTPPPRSHPPLDALGAYWDMVHEVMEAAGAAHGAVDDLARSAQAAGLEVIQIGGAFEIMEPDLGFGLHAASLAAIRARATQFAVVAEREIDELVSTLHAAQHGGYEWVSSPFLLDLELRKPLPRT